MPKILLAQSGSGLQFIELKCLLKVLPDQLWYGMVWFSIARWRNSVYFLPVAKAKVELPQKETC